MSDKWTCGRFTRYGNEAYDRIESSVIRPPVGDCQMCLQRRPVYQTGAPGQAMCGQCIALHRSDKSYSSGVPLIMIRREDRYTAGGVRKLRTFIEMFRQPDEPKTWDIILGLFGGSPEIEAALMAYCVDELEGKEWARRIDDG